MEMQITIPVQITKTLPDRWQDCQTPQQLSYWLIARLQEIQTLLDSLEDLPEEMEAMRAQLQGQIDTLGTRITSLNVSIANVSTVANEARERANRALDGVSTNRGYIEQLQAYDETNTANINQIVSNITALQTAVAGLSSLTATLRTDVNSNAANIALTNTRVSELEANNWYKHLIRYKVSASGKVCTCTVWTKDKTAYADVPAFIAGIKSSYSARPATASGYVLLPAYGFSIMVNTTALTPITALRLSWDTMADETIAVSFYGLNGGDDSNSKLAKETPGSYWFDFTDTVFVA